MKNPVPKSKKPQKQKTETHAECGIANFSCPGCQQSVGLIKIHQTSIRNKPITLFNTNKRINQQTDSEFSKKRKWFWRRKSTGKWYWVGLSWRRVGEYQSPLNLLMVVGGWVLKIANLQRRSSRQKCEWRKRDNR